MKSKEKFAARILRLEQIANIGRRQFQIRYLPNIFRMNLSSRSAEKQIIEGLLDVELDGDFLKKTYPNLDLRSFQQEVINHRKNLADASAKFKQQELEEQNKIREDRARRIIELKAQSILNKKREEEYRLKVEAEEKEAQRRRDIDIENERNKREVLGRLRRPILESIWNGFNDDYISTLKNLHVLDPKHLCDHAAVTLQWLRAAFTQRGYAHMSDEQLIAIGNCDDTLLLRARAGSGKTTVIKHKTDFLIRGLGIDPSELMILAFNKLAADQLNRGLQQGLNHPTFNNSRTFHSLAHRIVRPTEALLFDFNSGSNAKQSQFVERLIEKECNPAFQKDLYKFFRSELREMKNIGSLLSQQDYFSYVRNATHDTLAGEAVKSNGEKWIADFLFEHDIGYAYERAWYRDKSGEEGSYYPDFSLFVGGNIPDVVIEHWGIDELDESQSVPSHWNKTWNEYRSDMEIKRQYWQDWNELYPNRQVCFIETSVAYTRHGRSRFEDYLRQELGGIGIRCQKLAEDVLIEKVKRKHISRFSRVCLQFIQRAKKQRLSPEALERRIASHHFSGEKEQIFCHIAIRVFRHYEDELRRSNCVDFDDLMASAIDRIHSNLGNVVIDATSDRAFNLNSLKWLMIDEFQDFSPLFFELVSALRQYNSRLKLCCVGDNWQSINGFAGADLKFFESFEGYFPDCVMLDLQNNYRSQPNIVEQGNYFMSKNKEAPSIPMSELEPKSVRVVYSNQVFIEQRSRVTLENNEDKRYLTLIESRGELKDVNSTVARLLKACHSIMATYSLSDTSFMILNRTNYLGFKYEELYKLKKKLKSCFHKTQLRQFEDFDAQVDCRTMHRAKGEEADVVIVLNVLESKIPMIHSDSALYQLLGGAADEIYAEEERLFYVAITRAKKALYLITERGSESEFLERIRWVEYSLPALPKP